MHFINAVQPFIIGFVFLLIYIAEHIFPQRKDLKDNKHDLKNILIGAFNLIFTFVSGYYFQKLLLFSAPKHIAFINLGGLPSVYSLIGQVVVIDLYMYWWHRINHIVPLFWRFHKFHHLDEKMNSTTAVRFHTAELAFSIFFKALLFPLVGISVNGIILYGIIFFPVILVHHSNIRIAEKTDSRLRNLIVTPFMHRIHHSTIVKETNSNYGSVFPIWDLIFSSYRKKADKAIIFGVQ